MTTRPRLRANALCALIALGAALAAPPARAQVAGAYLVHAVTAASPASGESVVVDTVEPFQAGGGLAIFEPGSTSAEVFSYSGVDPATSELTGIVRTAPSAHPGGSFVQSIRDARPSPQPKPSPKPTPRPSPSPHGDDAGLPSHHHHPPARPAGSVRAKHHDRRGANSNRDVGPIKPVRSFDTKHLVAAVTSLVALGWSPEGAARAIFSPFPVEGATTFTNTWGAPRYGPAPGEVRRHEGQDLFCDYGTPLLAVASGRIQFDTNTLGGRIARLHIGNGRYWYYAHLSAWNTQDLHSGDHVRPGDVVGYCGHSGDAAETPNHLHFGWYMRDGSARNPLRALLGWLRRANDHATTFVARAERRASRMLGVKTTQRMFGDSWAPDLSSGPTPTPAAP